ncbi:MAG: Fic/DOC family protein, partial [Oscillospiraceae bacterium]
VKKLLEKLKYEKYLRGMDNEHFVDRVAYYMAELNAIHPFREGNGRTIREFIRQLCLYNGYVLNWSICSKDEVLEASIVSYDDYTALIPIITKCTSSQ